MKPTEKVSIGGYSFTLERDAYERLNGYIEDIRNTYRTNSYVNEIVGDIEQRIAELFLERCGKDSIVGYAAVDSVIQRIGSPDELAYEEDTETSHGRQKERRTSRGAASSSPKRLYRNTERRILGGVCSGIAAYFNTDTVIVRLCFIASVFLISVFFGDWRFPAMPACPILTAAGIYIIMWIITPAARTVEEKCRMNREPIEISQFKTKFETGVKEAAKDFSSAPALHAIGRIISIAAGIALIVSGVSVLMFCAMHDLVPGLLSRYTGIGRIGTYHEDSVLLSQLVLNPVTWWMTAGSLVLLAIWLIYNGTLASFNLKAPRWKPGTIIFILWIVSLLVLSAWIIRRLLTIGALI